MNKKVPNDYDYEDIQIGQVVEFEQEITGDMVNKFAELIGDYNPLHTDEEYAKTTQFKGRIAHGMLIASFFSTLVGMHCPGKKKPVLNTTIKFQITFKTESKN